MTKPIPYPKRVLRMAVRTITAWPRNMPDATRHLVDNLLGLIVALVGFIFTLVFPFTFILAPLYLWLFEEAVERRAKEEAEFEKWYGDAMRQQEERARAE